MVTFDQNRSVTAPLFADAATNPISPIGTRGRLYRHKQKRVRSRIPLVEGARPEVAPGRVNSVRFLEAIRPGHLG
jgi:hypothetical protein